MNYFKSLFIFSISILVFFSCQESKEKKTPVKTGSQKNIDKLGSSFHSPVLNERYKEGDTVRVVIEKIDTMSSIDSIVVIAGDKIFSLTREPFEYSFTTDGFPLGKINIKADVYYKENKNDFIRTAIILLAKNQPKKLTYKVNRGFPHDPKAFTQGLVYEDGYIYEGTGQWGGASSLRKVDLKTGDVLKIHNLETDFFGEGITIVGNKIYQVTYKARTGFVYDKSTFKEINQFNYPMKEGWGLTFDGTHLIMGDGTETIYFFDTTYFSEVRRIQVYDNNNSIKGINELEYINGKIYANIYQTDLVAIINPQNGELIATIDFKGLRNKIDSHQDIDVLNGIAYDKEKERMFITGKYWPVLFEVKLDKY